MATVPVVFLVEDDAAVRTAISLLLKHFGFEISTFDSAESFLKSYEETNSACLVSDIRMPGMSGLDLLIALKQQGSPLPVVLYSGYADSDIVTDAKKRGAIAVLAKPVGADTLHAAVREALRSISAEPVSD